ncbi:STAS domain-containing protein [Halobacillus sp. Marseille-Q1614]|uniref:STAS domain-containing protein n=1 Tax=Halobacillus sp. Marseille-Q1614 TaxID=2709134 RepID=UPI00156FEB3E|nr:STAS domain-containing protein [Halobacillus sp. Marseille-Q1614]
METTYQSSMSLKEFIQENKHIFESTLLSEAVTVKDKIEEILHIGNIDLVNNANNLVVYIIDGEDESLKNFAKHEGIAWATHSISLTFKLEWIHAVRRSIWKFIQKYYEYTEPKGLSFFFQMERKINSRVDDFLNTFFISYSTYKDSLIESQEKLVENLSVPIIPINSSICILPLIGAIDSRRAEILKEKVLTEVGNLRIQTLLVDLSGIADMEREVIVDLMNIIDGTSLMGCTTVITGLRKEIVTKMTRSGIPFNQQTKTLGTLQQALSEYFLE